MIYDDWGTTWEEGNLRDLGQHSRTVCNLPDGDQVEQRGTATYRREIANLRNLIILDTN